MKAMQTIGVIGGVGPQATMDFETRVHELAQRLIPSDAHHGYPPMVVYYHRFELMETPAECAEVAQPPVHPQLLDAARRLGGWADFLVMTCNTAHKWADAIAAAAGRPVLNMIELTVAEVRRRQWRTVGVMTFAEPSVYQQPLERQGLTCEVLTPELQAPLNRAIQALSAGHNGPADRAAAEHAVAALRTRGVDGIVLGCTEVPLLLGAAADAPDLINPVALLAEAAVRRAIG